MMQFVSYSASPTPAARFRTESCTDEPWGHSGQKEIPASRYIGEQVLMLAMRLL